MFPLLSGAKRRHDTTVGQWQSYTGMTIEQGGAKLSSILQLNCRALFLDDSRLFFNILEQTNECYRISTKNNVIN